MKIYKITEASNYLGVSINTLKTLANNGIDGMSLVDLIEMLCDWKAATERHDDGCIKASLEHNEERFKIGGQLGMILRNTVERFGW
jgi:hypothetical protein